MTDEVLQLLSPISLGEPVVKSTFYKKLSFGKLPNVLVFHVQRTVWMSNGMPVKRYDHVQVRKIGGWSFSGSPAPLSDEIVKSKFD